MATTRCVRKEMPVSSIIIGGMHLYLFGLPKRVASIKSELKEPPKLLPIYQEIPRRKPPQFGEYYHGRWLPNIFEKKGDLSLPHRPNYKTISCAISNKFRMTNKYQKLQDRL